MMMELDELGMSITLERLEIPRKKSRESIRIGKRAIDAAIDTSRSLVPYSRRNGE